MKKHNNKVKVVKVLTFTKNQKHFIDFILIVAVIFGFLSLTGAILLVTGIIPSNYDSYRYYLYIVDIIILSFCELYLIIYKFYRIFKRY